MVFYSGGTDPDINLKLFSILRHFYGPVMIMFWIEDLLFGTNVMGLWWLCFE